MNKKSGMAPVVLQQAKVLLKDDPTVIGAFVVIARQGPDDTTVVSYDAVRYCDADDETLLRAVGGALNDWVEGNCWRYDDLVN